MTLTTQERTVLRELAQSVAEAASNPAQAQKETLWEQCNRLNPTRPMVLLDPQNGWGELVPETSLVCKDPFFRAIELRLRRLVFRINHIPDDYPITRLFRVYAPVSRSNYGVELVTTRPAEANGAYHIEPVIQNEEDFHKLRPITLSVDREKWRKETELTSDLLGDILDVQPWGIDSCRCGLSRVLVHLRGLEQLYFDMYDCPELLHKLMAFLRDQQLAEYAYYQQNKLLSPNTLSDCITGSGGLSVTSELSHAQPNRMQSMVAWGESQEFSSVGRQHFEEFILPYQLDVLQQFGLVDYGCCEPLDTRFDSIIQSIPNLRFVAVSPWCDRDLAAEKLGKNYVYVYKPNPSPICMASPDWDYAKKSIKETLKIAANSPTHIVMKDTSTFCNDPNRTTQWAKMAKELCENA